MHISEPTTRAVVDIVQRPCPRSVFPARHALAAFLAIATLPLGCSTPSFARFRTPSAGLGYQPLDPISISSSLPATATAEDILALLPNETIRMAVGRIDSAGAITYGPFGVAHKGETYTLILDYIKYTTLPLPVEYDERAARRSDGSFLHSRSIKTLAGRVSSEIARSGIDALIQSNPLFADVRIFGEDSQDAFEVNQRLPIYVGIGLRIQASIVARDRDVSLSSFYALGVAASERRISGNLIVQALGVGGPSVSSAIPLPDEINMSTLQSAMQALAAIKANLYNNEMALIRPQILAYENRYDIPGARELLLGTICTLDVELRPGADGPLEFTVR